VWSLLVAAALVTGLVGGMLGGALVLGSGAGSDGDLLPPAGNAAPLDADNASVAAVAAKVLPSTVQVRVINGKGKSATGATGSGFVIDERGHVITNNHVVEVAEDDAVIDVVDMDGAVHSAEVVGRSPVYDIAVLEVSSNKGLRPAALGASRQLRVGETVVAIGSPLGLSSTVTAGIVSALDRPVTTGPAGSPSPSDPSAFINAVQTDAAINPGNSGGPLVNLRGQVVGVNSAIATTGGALGGEAGNIGVGFAIPMDQVRITAKQILDTGRAEYPVIGANVNTTDSSDGATVVDVPEGTPAAEAGLLEGDRIVAVEGERVPDGVSLIVAIRTHRPGETIELTVVRDDEERTVEVKLAAKVG
jgi:putative serine protease PepD